MLTIENVLFDLKNLHKGHSVFNPHTYTRSLLVPQIILKPLKI